MQRLIKQYFWVILLAAGLGTSRAFVPGGPTAPSNGADSWQTTDLDYAYPLNESYGTPGDPVNLLDIMGPRNAGEEYRRNVPIVYYTYDTSFLNFFGSNGVAAVDSAMAIMNSITNVDTMDFTQFPMDSQHYNYTAGSLYLTDLKSTTLHLLIEQMGLAQPERWIWALQYRYLPTGNTCPTGEEYLLTERNLAFTNATLFQVNNSTYVNNVLYTYEIVDACKATPPSPVIAQLVPFSVDQYGDQYTAVADNTYETSGGGLQIGGFYSTLTMDDVAGLKYLYSTNTINWERATPGSTLLDVATNYSSGQTLFPVNANTSIGYGTFNYGTLLAAAAGTAPANLPAQFPGLVVSSSRNFYIVTNVPTVTSYYAPAPTGSAYGSPPVLVVTTNYTPTPLQEYVTTFANVVTQYTATNTPAILQTVTIGPGPVGGVYGTTSTNVSNKNITLKGVPTGSFYILPTVGTNLCPAGILYTLLTNVIYTTNVVTTATTNVVSTNTAVYTTTMNLITWYTNYTYVTYTVNCGQTAGATGLFEGIEGVQFVREDYDSLLGQFFQPVTNGYSMNAVTNGQVHAEHFDRVVTGPELLLQGNINIQNDTAVGTVNRSTPNWDESQLKAGGLAGPGVIDPTAVLDYNVNGTTFWNGYAANTSLTPVSNYGETTQSPALAWGSFDDSTNDPVVYPNGSSIANLANQVLIQITPPSLPNGTNGVPYSQQFTANAPRLTGTLTWAAAGLPPGLTMSSNGLLSGTPIDQTGGHNSPLTYDITIILTDAAGTTVQWNYPLIIQ